MPCNLDGLSAVPRPGMFLSRLHCQLVLASLRLELGEMQEVLFEGVFRVRILSETSGHGQCECPDVFLSNRSRVLVNCCSGLLKCRLCWRRFLFWGPSSHRITCCRPSSCCRMQNSV